MTTQVTILWPVDKEETKFDFVVLDASLSESHAATVDVTEHPVETGAKVVDHLIPAPDDLSIEGVVSNTPAIIGAPARADGDRGEQAYQKLLNLKNRGFLAFISTSLREYEQMAMTSLSIPRDSARGDSVFISLSFRQVLIAISQEVEAPEPTMERAKPRKPAGRKASKDTSLQVEEKTQSLVVAFGEAVGSILGL